MDIADAVIVVTGASSGIGRATAAACAAKSARVVLAARASRALDEAAAECRDAGGQVVVVPTDVADGHAVDKLAARAVEEFGRIDVWVNDAAVMAYGRFEDTPADVHRRVIDVNLFGQVHGARAVLPVFRWQGAGILINVASLYGKMTSPYVSAYVTSKFGVIGFSEVLRQETQGTKNIHVCTVLPGSVDTPIFRHAANHLGHQPRPVPAVSSPDRVVRAILRLIRWPRRQVAIGWSARFFAVGHALAPGLYHRLAPVVMDVLGSGRGESEESTGNVFQPMPEWNQVQGGWRRPLAVRLVAGALAMGAVVTLWDHRWDSARGQRRGARLVAGVSSRLGTGPIRREAARRRIWHLPLSGGS